MREPSLDSYPTQIPGHQANTSPANLNELTTSLANYIERPWLQHDRIDGAAINAILFSQLASYLETYRTGKLFGRTNWTYVLSEGDLPTMIWLASVLRVGRFFLRWIMLPAIAIGLSAIGYKMGAGIAMSLWLVYLLYRFVTIPVRRRTRRTLRKEDEKASQTIAAMKQAWQHSNSSVINPSRLKELVLAAERHGATYQAVLHTLIDRAMQRDPTALLTSWSARGRS